MIPVSRPVPLLIIFACSVIVGGLTFNITTISLPKVIDERLGATLSLTMIGSVATAVFVFGALTQLLMGRLIDRFSIPSLYIALSALQPIGLAIAAFSSRLHGVLHTGPEYAFKLIQERGYTAPQVSFVLANLGASLLEIRAGKDAAVTLLRGIGDSVEEGVPPTMIH